MAVQLEKQYIDAGIVTTDPEAAHRFYGEALGLPLEGEIEIPQYGLVRRYKVGQSTLRVFVPLAQPAREGSRDGFASQTGIRYLTLYVSNLEDATAAVAAAGFKVAVPVRDLRPGVRVSQVEDADGNAVELMEES
ncbi:MAG: VOC family protein [Halioglobus sp.]